jgi:hypothetical protein
MPDEQQTVTTDQVQPEPKPMQVAVVPITAVVPLAPDPGELSTDVAPKPSGSAFGAGSPAGLGNSVLNMPLPSSPAENSRRLSIPMLITLGVVLVAGTVGTVMAMGSKIHTQDVRTAQHAAIIISSDLGVITSAITDADSQAADSDSSASPSTIRAKLADAQKQYTVLQKSAVLHNNTVKQKFAALTAKWPAYSEYVSGNADDLADITPVMNELQKNTSALTSTPPTTIPTLGTFLTSYKSVVDTTSAKIAKLHMKVTENQQILDSLKTFLAGTSTNISDGQRDLAAADLTAVQADMGKIEDDSSTFGSSMTTLQTTVDKRQKQLSPDTQLQALQTSLDSLAKTVH